MSTSIVAPTAIAFLDAITIPMTELPPAGVVVDPATGLAIGMLIACLGLATMAARDGIRARRAARRDVTE
jgi:hypothetical protein